MRQLTHHEQYRSSFLYEETKGRMWGNKSVLYTGKNPDPNETCFYCKYDFPDVIRDKAYLASFESNPFFKGRKFKVFYCHYCNAIFSWHKEREE